MTWDNAKRFYNNKHRSHTWNLPTVKQLQVIYKYFDEINKVIEDNDGFVLLKDVYWSIKDKDKFCAWNVDMKDGDTYTDFKHYDIYVRAVATL